MAVILAAPLECEMVMASCTGFSRRYMRCVWVKKQAPSGDGDDICLSCAVSTQWEEDVDVSWPPPARVFARV